MSVYKYICTKDHLIDKLEAYIDTNTTHNPTFCYTPHILMILMMKLV